MARTINEQADKAKADYLAGMKYKDIAKKYGVSINTVNSWKKRHRWCKDGAPKNGAPKKNSAPKKHGGQPGNKNAVGHGAPPGNQNARTHGLFAKYLPEDVYKIAKDLDGLDQLEVLWGNITLQYAKIIHAQQVMHVVSKDELIRHVKAETESSITYEFQYAWDRQAKDLTAQSKAMSALNAMIKQYDELCRSELATEAQRLRIEKLKLDIKEKSEDVTDGNDSSQDGFKAALLGQVKDVWGDEE